MLYMADRSLFTAFTASDTKQSYNPVSVVLFMEH